MLTTNEKKVSGDSRPTIPSLTKSGSTNVKESRSTQLEQATKTLFRSSVRKKDRTVSNTIASIQFGSIGALVPQDHQNGVTPVLVDSSVKDLLLLPEVTPQHPTAPSATETDSEDLTHSPSNALQLLSTPNIAESKAEVPALSADVSDVEYDLHRLRMRRLKEPEHDLYVPPQAKPALQSSDDTLFPLMEKTLEFLTGSAHAILLLGDSGGGKSTFNLQLERTLWKDYKRDGAIPLHINLPAIDNPQQDMIAKQLQQLHLFSDAQIQELRQSRQFIVICDG
ncbi:hypothetical protein BGX24_009504 [Mortierella sp. AD032]|nr:hypothetical protein BGX24_009504 [Mortierella sp. AD032]